MIPSFSCPCCSDPFPSPGSDSGIDTTDAADDSTAVPNPVPSPFLSAFVVSVGDIVMVIMCVMVDEMTIVL